MSQPLVIGTRGSALAMWQAEAVARRLGVVFRIQVVETAGDRLLDVPLAGRLEKGFFTREIEAHLMDGRIDLAVHSLKDLPTVAPPGLIIAAHLPRGPVSDLLLVHPDWHRPGERVLPVLAGGRVGTGSPRRQALLRAVAPELVAAPLRGNVPTRIAKCVEGRYAAIVIARAGVERLGADLGPLAAYELDPARWLPAPGQGVVAVQARADDPRPLACLAGLDHLSTRRAAAIERGLMAGFGGGCHTPFGALAEPDGDGAIWRVRVGLADPPAGAWRATRMAGDWEGCRDRDPAEWRPLLLPAPYDRRNLCRPYP